MNDLIVSYIRTTVPMIVGALVSWLATRGININESAALGLTAFLTGLFGSLYYLAVRVFERKHPQVGVLLGVAKKPEYK